MSPLPKRTWYIILGLLALVVFVGAYWYATRKIRTDVPGSRQASIKAGVAYNPNKDLWLTRATDLAVAIKQIDSTDDCRRMVAGICGTIEPIGNNDLRTWYDACACEVVGRVCYPSWRDRRDFVSKNRNQRAYSDAWHVIERKEAMIAAKQPDSLPWK